MRELLFKGKAKGTGEWMSGGYLRAEAKYYFKKDQALIHSYIASDWTTYFGLPSELTIHEVEPITVCQYTGLTDKNGKKIFEGDVVKDSAGVCGEVKFGLYSAGFGIQDINQGFYIEFPEESLYRKELGYWENAVAVVGNIYDNPELLEDKEKLAKFEDEEERKTTVPTQCIATVKVDVGDAVEMAGLHITISDTKEIRRMKQYLSSEKKLVKHGQMYGREWIPCSERLPKKSKVNSFDSYIVQCRHVMQPFSAYWDGIEWTDDDDDAVDDVIAWMPLPEPYKGE